MTQRFGCFVKMLKRYGQLGETPKLTTPDPLFGASNGILKTETPLEEP